jgi:hypothetical protein
VISRVNPLRRYLAIFKDGEPLVGAWVDEHGRMLSVPRWAESWKRQPWTEFRDWLYQNGYEAQYTGRSM